MSKGLKQNFEIAKRRVLHRTGGLGYWAARDLFKKVGHGRDLDAPPVQKHHDDSKHERITTPQVCSTAFDMRVDHVSVGMTPFFGEAQEFFKKKTEHLSHTISVYMIDAGLRNKIMHQKGRGFKVDKVAHFRV